MSIKMIFLQKCCCGCSLKTGSLIVCYIVLTENILTFLNALMNSDDVSAAKSIISTRNETSSAKFFNIWTSAFNIFIDGTGLYGIYKQKAPLMIPFLAYRTVNLIFMSFTLFNSKNIADALSQEVRKQVDNGASQNEIPDLFPFVLIVIILMMVVELYCVLVVYSYYQMLCQNSRMIAVSVPIVTYSVQAPDQMNMYTQPPVNPYLFQAPKYPYQFENSKYAYNPNPLSTPNQLPPPYGT